MEGCPTVYRKDLATPLGGRTTEHGRHAPRAEVETGGESWRWKLKGGNLKAET